MTLRKTPKRKLKITFKPVVKTEKINFWSVFKSFVLVGGDLV